MENTTRDYAQTKAIHYCGVGISVLPSILVSPARVSLFLVVLIIPVALVITLVFLSWLTNVKRLLGIFEPSPKRSYCIIGAAA